MTVPPLPPALLSRGGDPALVAEEYLWMIKQAIANQPRSLQKMIGPSAIGGECARRIGYQLLDVPTRQVPPNWKATVGTGVHLWLEGVFGGRDLATVPMVEGEDQDG